ncbi:MAG: sigma-70 family RNA polymerase sigma factor [Deltaproteobacteria bacterium]|nr:sigma-70 family RNA polymerase sigma factor [Deltaproteobacteria bacterium]
MDAVVLADLQLARAVRSDPEAAEGLLRRVHPRVLAVVRATVGGGRAEVDELVQACLVELLRSLDGYRGAGTLESWAGRVAFRTVMRSLKRRRRWERGLDGTADDAAEPGPGPEAEALRRQAWERLVAGLRRVPEERRATLFLRLVEEHSVAEVAELTGVSVNTVKDRLRTGLRELRALFARDRVLGEMMREVADGR